jgi:hypothetical protein
MIIRPKKKKETTVNPFGGHILNPDKSICSNPHKIFKNGLNTWIDCGVCHRCTEKEQCSIYKKWKDNDK